MKISVASGKGGTGKTTIATNLAAVAAGVNEDVIYLDCDVEEPNGHLFLKPVIEKSESVSIPVPSVDSDLCTGCGVCSRVCQYSAIACVRSRVLTFPELCHGCGGCSLACPEGAISEAGRDTGIVEEGISGSRGFVHGKLKIGEAMSPPLIKAVKRRIQDSAVNIIDAPPGTSCPVITAILGSNIVILVTEPTPFGLNDLGLALDMVNGLNLPHVVVVNRHEEDNGSAREFCGERNVNIIAEIPDDRRVAEAYSRGDMVVRVLPEYRHLFLRLWEELKNGAGL